MSYDYEAARKKEAETRRQRQAEERAKKKRARVEKEKKAKKQAKWDAKKKQLREELSSTVNGMLGGETTPGAYGTPAPGSPAPASEPQKIKLNRGPGLGGSSRRSTPKKRVHSKSGSGSATQEQNSRASGQSGGSHQAGSQGPAAPSIKLKRPV